MNNIKTDKRNRLLEDTLKELMFISLNGEDPDNYNYYSACEVRLLRSMKETDYE